MTAPTPPTPDAGLPNFLLLGAQKAGTTALYHFLSQHPDVFMPELKEPHFFSYEAAARSFRGPGQDSRIVRDWDEYRALFAGAGGATAIGEASPSYLYMPTAAERIALRLPGVRLIAVLRQPVDRAYSNYLHAVRAGREPLERFEDAVAAEAERIEAGWGPLWHYLAKGRYREQLERYRARFPHHDLEVFLHEDLRADMAAVLARIFGFVGVDASFRPDTSARHNVSRIPASPLSRALVSIYQQVPGALRDRLLPPPLRHRLRDRLLERPAELDPALRAELTERHFRHEIQELEALLDRDLSAWLKGVA